MDFGKVIYYSENIDIGFVGNETESYLRVRALIAKYLWFHYRFKKENTTTNDHVQPSTVLNKERVLITDYNIITQLLNVDLVYVCLSQDRLKFIKYELYLATSRILEFSIIWLIC